MHDRVPHKNRTHEGRRRVKRRLPTLLGGVVVIGVALTALGFDVPWNGRPGPTEGGAATPPALAAGAPGGASGTQLAMSSGDKNDLRSDPRVRAFVEAYGQLIDSVTYGADDVVFALGTRPIHFQDGRMLAEGRLDRRDDCDPIFYPYSLEPLTEPPPSSDEDPTYCTDVLESLWGRTEAEIRRYGQPATFLDHRMFVNDLLVGPLASVEAELLDLARSDRAVAAWIDGLDITYSFTNREIAGSPTRSQHAWGMAVDLVPESYDGLQVYWRWSRVFNREEWAQAPLDQRWSPPLPVIEVFENHGFVWGGKWTHFDVIHFEYRPEILIYNRLISVDGA